MNRDIKWRFPSNSYASTTGLDTADIETFKSDESAALAREITQNSIDARLIGITEPVRIEFKLFSIKREEIPGLNDIVENINNCIDYWQDYGSSKTVEALKKMLKEINRDNIVCLRISDYNTTGLVGVSKNENSPWNNLIHGSGVSEKSSTSGGSKGIGKFATFVNSYFRLVFYSTKTCDGELGYEGICKLCSGNIPNSDQKTQGIGYFGSNEKNHPIFEELKLDASHQRKEREYGTDIYIIGFKNDVFWKEDIICKILDSFMSAIIYRTLEVIVDDIVVNNSTLNEIVSNDKIIRTKQAKQKIRSQYLLLTDKDTYTEEIEVSPFGTIKLFVKTFEGKDEEIATNKCTMIRYPYMKIKEKQLQSLVKISALCIIPDNKLNVKLREIENPQHIDWEFNRIEDPVLRNDFKAKIDSMYKKINEVIAKYTLKESQKVTELEGSEEFISQDDFDIDADNSEIMRKTEKPNVTDKYRHVERIDNGKIPDTDVENETPQYGEYGPGEKEYPHGEGGRKGEGNGRKTGTAGQGEIYQLTELRGLKFKFMRINKIENMYLVSFVSEIDEGLVKIIIRGQDEGNYAIPLNISECTVNNQIVEVENSESISLKLEKGNKYNIIFKTTEDELFACWIKAYAYKK